MKRERSAAILFRLVRYSEQSAIVHAITEQFGKVKLFVPKAYTKKGGVHRYIPGTLDFLKKDSSDLCKYYDFRQDVTCYHYLDNNDILTRLHLAFEVYDALYPLEVRDDVVWKLFHRYTGDNAPKLTLYLLNAMLGRSGYPLNADTCASCGGEMSDEGWLEGGVILCPLCAARTGRKVEARTMLFLRACSKHEVFRSLVVNREDERAALRVLFHHAEQMTGKKLKSLTFFEEVTR